MDQLVGEPQQIARRVDAGDPGHPHLDDTVLDRFGAHLTAMLTGRRGRQVSQIMGFVSGGQHRDRAGLLCSGPADQPVARRHPIHQLTQALTIPTARLSPTIRPSRISRTARINRTG